MTQSESRPHLPATAALAALLFSLALCSLVVLNHLKYPLARSAEAGAGVGALPGVVFSNLRAVDWLILGLTVAAALAAVAAALAAVAVVAAVRGRLSGAARATVLAATSCLLLSFFLRGGHVRDIIYTLFFVALLAAFGAAHLAATARPRVILAAACLLFIDIGTAAVQPHARTDKGFYGVAAERLERDAASARVLVAGQRGGDISISIGPGGSPLLYAKVQQLTGAHNLTATLTHNYVAATIKLAERDLRETGALGPDAARASDAQYGGDYRRTESGPRAAGKNQRRGRRRGSRPRAAHQPPDAAALRPLGEPG